ncbi:MAG: GNAT family N-acetyltransferase [Fibrobacter sp.]|nr:GNAT family N-acetyltransferase [Fibrobacter sp.]
MITINFLKCHQQHTRTVADWVYNEWWRFKKGCSFSDVVRIYSGMLNECSLPMVLIALKGNKPVGSVLICEHNPFIKINQGPWIEDLFVKPEYRKQGIGRELVIRAVQITENLGYRKLYLSTHIEAYYLKLGWNKVRILRNNDSLMEFNMQESLCRSPAGK